MDEHWKDVEMEKARTFAYLQRKGTGEAACNNCGNKEERTKGSLNGGERTERGLRDEHTREEHNNPKR